MNARGFLVFSFLSVLPLNLTRYLYTVGSREVYEMFFNIDQLLLAILNSQMIYYSAAVDNLSDSIMIL